MPARIEFHPATPARWRDVESLFGPRGACGGCWCMYWRLRRQDFDAGKGQANRRRLKRLVTDGPPPGILGYVDGQPAGWCAIAPRPSYPVLGNSRILSPVDDKPVWSVTCLFVAKGFRRSGLSSKLVRAAAAFARQNGARWVEGYPVEPKQGAMPDPFVWTGLPGSFQKAGFKEAARRSPTRPIMRKKLRQARLQSSVFRGQQIKSGSV